MTERMEDVDLNSEAAKAATYYMEKTGLMYLSMDEKQKVVNYVAIGFSIGVRWHESEMKIQKLKDQNL